MAWKRSHVIGVCSLIMLAALSAFCATTSTPSFGMVKKFQTIYLQIVHKSRPTRNAAHSDQLDVKITSESGENFTLRLTLNDVLLSPNFESIYFTNDDQEIRTTDQVNCFNQGEVLEHPEWNVAMDSCQGLRGSFGDWNNKSQHYIVEPLSMEDTSLSQPHIMYLAEDSTYEEGKCGTGGHSHIDDITDPLILDENIRERAHGQTNPYYVELHIVNDHAEYLYYGNLERTVVRAIAHINVADVDVGMTPCQKLLKQEGTARRIESMQQSSATPSLHILVFGDFLNTMCGFPSVAIVSDWHFNNSLSTGSVLAHEIGHLFDMHHDELGINCSCADERCVMATYANILRPAQAWSSCSVDTISRVFGRVDNNLARCLHNVPEYSLGDPVCGDGIVQGDEVCDCGTPQECTDPCCDARTCRLVQGAQCHAGECCTSQCHFKSSSFVCRPAGGTCDIEDYCTGDSSDCPEDLYVQDGTLCNNNQAYCYLGECKTYNDQCQKHFQSNKGAAECFQLYNTRGDHFGNCGSDGTNYVPCLSNNVMCGQLFCEVGIYQNLVGSVFVLTVEAFIFNVSIVECNTFTTLPNADIVSPGLVEDGIMCGTGSLCLEQRCVTVSSLGLPQCPTDSNGRVCSGNEKCNNKGQCSCFFEFSGPACEDYPVSPTYPPPCPPMVYPRECGGNLTESSGTLKTPG